MAKGKYEGWISGDGLIKIEGWARDGLTEEQIAANMGIGRSTLSAWKNQFPDIVEALKKGKEVFDRQVENALFKSAMGYFVEEERIDDDGVTTIKKYIQPNTTAQIFWLKNRKPAQWRDKVETEISGKDGGAIQVQSMSAEQIDARIAELSARLARG